jgi:hypothetical protein
MKVILDTNAIYYLETKLSVFEFNILKNLVNLNKLQVYISPISVIEIASRIKNKFDDFTLIKKILTNLFLLNPIFLNDPEEQLREYFCNIALDINWKWKEVLYSIKTANSVLEIENGFIDIINQTKRHVDLSYFAKAREDYEILYVQEIMSAIQKIIPEFTRKISKNKNTRLSKDNKKEFDNFLNSVNWSKLFEYILLQRANYPFPNNTKSKELILEKAYYFKIGYENLLKKIFYDGYIPNANKKNDYNDLHFTIYINKYNEYIFITNEDNAIFNQLRKDGKCMNIEVLIQQLNINHK